MKLSLKLSAGFFAVASFSSPAMAGVIFQTGFESPTYAAGALAGQDGWTVFGTSASVNVQSAVVLTGTQAVRLNGSAASPIQTGPYHSAATTGPIVTLEIDAFLTSSNSMSTFQFSGMNTFTTPGFIGGFNALPNGTLQLQTPGLPTTAAVIVRNTWQHWLVTFNFPNQTFDVAIAGSTVASNRPFLSSFNSFGVGFFDVFADLNHNDFGYFDNFSVTSSGVPEPGTVVLMSTGLALLVVAIRRRKS